MFTNSALILGFLAALALPSSVPAVEADEIHFAVKDTAKWNMPHSGFEVVDYKGKSALRLKEGDGERIAWLKEFRFQNDIIELDIAAVPSFTGLAFRVRSDHIYETVYFRPQNSRVADPVRRGHTIQYISNPGYTWYHLREKFPEKYESGADLEPQEWFHVKVIVDGRKAEVYVNDAEQPCLVVDEMFGGVSAGSLGLWVGNKSSGTFANLKLTTLPTEEKAQEVSFTAEQEYLFDIFKTRRSIRRFKPDAVPDEHLMKMLEIAHSAPTSGNQQPWKFLVTKNRAKLEELGKAIVERNIERIRESGDLDEAQLEQRREQIAARMADYLSAPVYVTVLVDKNSRYPSYNVYDGSLAAGYLLIAARALGYGTVFITDAIPFEVEKEVFGIPDNFERICITPIGVPESWPEPRGKKPLGDVVVFERLIQGVNFEVPVTRTAIELPLETLEKYVGKYELNPQLSVTITIDGGSIFAQATGQPRVELFAEAEDEFFLKVMDAQISFTKDENGKVAGLVLRQGGNEFPAKKIEEEQP